MGAFQPGAETLREGYGNRANQLMDQFGGLSEDVTGGFRQRQEDVMGRLRPQLEQLGQGFGEREQALGGRFDELSSGILGGYDTLRGEARDLLEGMGEYERGQIERRHGRARGRALSDLSSRGLGGSTLRSGLERGAARDLSQEMGGLDERLRRERLGAEMGIGMGKLGAQRGLGEFGSLLRERLGGDRLGFGERAASMEAGLGSQLSGDTMQAMQQMGLFGSELGARLTGEELGAGERLLGQETGLRSALSGERLGAQERLGQAQIGARQQYMGDLFRMFPELERRFGGFGRMGGPPRG
jgi:hypothetical protein